MAGSRGSGGGRGLRGGATAKWAMHLSMACGPMETQGALVDGTVRLEVSQTMTLKARIGILRMGRYKRYDPLQSVILCLSLTEEYGFARGDRVGGGGQCGGVPKNWRGHSQGSMVFSDEAV